MGAYYRQYSQINPQYILPVDQQESDRHANLDTALNIAINGLYPYSDLVEMSIAPIEGVLRRILDIGIGDCKW